MSAWIVVTIAVVGIAGWMAVMIRCAPLGIQDEGGFHLVGPDGANIGFVNAEYADRFYWSTTSVLLMPF